VKVKVKLSDTLKETLEETQNADPSYRVEKVEEQEN